jgi:hypothetical protein
MPEHFGVIKEDAFLATKLQTVTGAVAAADRMTEDGT